MTFATNDNDEVVYARTTCGCDQFRAYLSTNYVGSFEWGWYPLGGGAKQRFIMRDERYYACDHCLIVAGWFIMTLDCLYTVLFLFDAE